MSPDTGMPDMADVPRLVHRDITKLNNVVSDDNSLWYRNADSFIQIKSFEVKVLDILKDHKFVPMTVQFLSAGARIVKHVVFSLPTILVQLISPNVHFDA